MIVFASALAVWHVTVGVRAVMGALNAIHGVAEKRSLARRALVSFGLGVVVVLCLVASVLVVVVAPLIGGGAVHLVFGLGRWLVAAALLAVAVGLLVRYAPAERPGASWASAGSVLIVVTWIGASALFGLWIGSVADFKSVVGSLTVLLVVTAYFFVSAGIFLVGVALDEVLRKESGGEACGALARGALSRGIHF